MEISRVSRQKRITVTEVSRLYYFTIRVSSLVSDIQDERTVMIHTDRKSVV